jgi:hypothetical protein
MIMSARSFFRMAPVLAVALVTSASSDCAGVFGVDCTLIGCADGLGVLIEGELSGPATVRVTAGEEERTFSCVPTHPCVGFFEGWAPAQVEIEVVREEGTFTTQATPEYQLLYPNGRRCGPECRQGSVEVALP